MTKERRMASDRPLSNRFTILSGLVLFVAILSVDRAQASSPHPTTSPPLDRTFPITDFAGVPRSVSAGSYSPKALRPLVFEENRGQVDPSVAFLGRGSTYELFMRHNGEIWFTFPSSGLQNRDVLRLRVARSSSSIGVEGLDPQPGVSSYFRGNDPARWHTNVPNFARVRFPEILPGIDWIFHVDHDRLEYDFNVAPGADPRTIEMTFDDPSEPDRLLPLRVDAEGRLEVQHGENKILFEAPALYQMIDGKKTFVEGRFRLSDGKVQFDVGKFDATRALTIDPVLYYSTYLGGTHQDWPQNMDFDAAGNVYVATMTFSIDFPAVNAIQPIHAQSPLFTDTWDTAITKLDPTGSQILFSTFIGGDGENRYPILKVVPDGLLVEIGLTTADDLPMVNALFPTLRGGVDLALFKLAPDGSSILFSTYVGSPGWDIGAFFFGIDPATSLDVDDAGRIFLAGMTFADDFPTVNAFQPSRNPGTCTYWFGDANCPDGFFMVLSPDASSIVYSTYYGGTGDEGPFLIQADGDGNIYFIAFPPASIALSTVNALYPIAPGGGDLYIGKIKPDGSPPIFATYFGGSLDEGGSMVVDDEGRIVLTGSTTSGCVDFPLRHSFQACNILAVEDGFIARLNNRGTALDFSTLLSGTGHNHIASSSIDRLGNPTFGGQTTATDFPTQGALWPTSTADWTALVGYLHETGPTLLFSSYFSDAVWSTTHVGPRNRLWLAGITGSPDLPLTPNAIQTTYQGDPLSGDAFVAAIELGRAVLATPSRVPVETGQTVEIPVTLISGSLSLAAVSFSIDVPDCLAFDPTDGNSDQIPDAIVFETPAAFSKLVHYDPLDSDGELDIAIFDATVPLAELETSRLMRITFTATCNPPTGQVEVPLPFSSDPSPVFGDTSGHDAPGQALVGSVEIFGGLRGDCNGNGLVNVADLPACGLELADSDGSFWLDAGSSTFAGNPYGCDANGDTTIDAGDLACKLLLIFPPATCSTRSNTPGAPRLVLPEHLDLPPGQPAILPIVLEKNGASVRSVVFSLDLPASAIAFNGEDQNHDGLPDAVVSHLPSGFEASVWSFPERAFGELVFVITPPRGTALLPDGPLFELRLDNAATAGPETALIRFGTEPRASWGSADGASLPGDATARTEVSSLPAPAGWIFGDGFETGTTANWSGASP